MPIFEYRCQACDYRFEKLLRHQGEVPESCPECGRQTLKKMFSSFSPAVGPPSSPCGSGDCPSASEGGCPGGGCPF